MVGPSPISSLRSGGPLMSSCPARRDDLEAAPASARQAHRRPSPRRHRSQSESFFHRSAASAVVAAAAADRLAIPIDHHPQILCAGMPSSIRDDLLRASNDDVRELRIIEPDARINLEMNLGLRDSGDQFLQSFLKIDIGGIAGRRDDAANVAEKLSRQRLRELDLFARVTFDFRSAASRFRESAVGDGRGSREDRGDAQSLRDPAAVDGYAVQRLQLA